MLCKLEMLFVCVKEFFVLGLCIVRNGFFLFNCLCVNDVNDDIVIRRFLGRFRLKCIIVYFSFDNSVFFLYDVFFR